MVILFAIIFFSLFGAINYYIGLRGWQGIGSSIPMISSRVYWILFWSIAMSYVLAKLIGRYLPSILSNVFEEIGAYWIAMMFYLIFVLLMVDLIRFINRKINILPNAFVQNQRAGLLISVTIIIFLVILMIYGTWSARSIKVTTYNLQINKQCEDINRLKIVMVSDIHLGNIISNSRLTVMVDKINELKPDIVLIPGDIIDDMTGPFMKQKMGENFKRIKTKYGVFASLGNHDGMIGNANDTVMILEGCGIRVLRDKAILIDNDFYIVGRDDESVYRGSKGNRKSLNKILEDTNKSKPILLMDHQPREFEIAEKEGVDLQVSGHTHKGQMFPSNYITRIIYEIDYGYLKKGNLNIIVSSGIGTWGPPIRIGSRSEIVEILTDFK